MNIATELTQATSPTALGLEAVHPENNSSNDGDSVAMPPSTTPSSEVTKLLEAVATLISRQSSLPEARPSFAGLPSEDPEVYLRQVEDYAARNPQPDLTKFAANQLKGAAAQWFRSYVELSLSWVQFRELLIRKYASAEVTANLLSKLYGQKQVANEPAEIFLRKKIELFRRLQPSVSEEEAVKILIELLTPALRPYLRMGSLASFEELLERASVIEGDLAQLKSSAPRREEPPKCRMCPGYHYHKDCPERRPPPPENWRRAEPATAQPPAQVRP